jgi:hypothetical protein
LKELQFKMVHYFLSKKVWQWTFVDTEECSK